MTNQQASDKKDSPSELPAPEVLQSQTDDEEVVTPEVAHVSRALPQRRHSTYRPSHKATFIGVAVVAGILAINIGVVLFVMNSQSTAGAESSSGEVTLSSAELDKLGVSRNSIGKSADELVVDPNSKFNGDVTMANNVSIAGELKLNSKFTAADASLVKLQAGETSLGQLNVSGDATVNSLNLRKDLAVVGVTRLQGPVTMSQLLTINNSATIVGNLSVGGVLSARAFQASSLVSDTTLTIGGHIVTRGAAPGVGPGSGLGANGTVSISGNDASGTVAANIGTGGGNGILVQVSFRNQYSSTPHVIITTVGAGMGPVYVNRTVGGFSIGVNGSVGPGGYAFDYIVTQ